MSEILPSGADCRSNRSARQSSASRTPGSPGCKRRLVLTGGSVSWPVAGIDPAGQLRCVVGENGKQRRVEPIRAKWLFDLSLDAQAILVPGSLNLGRLCGQDGLGGEVVLAACDSGPDEDRCVVPDLVCA